MTIRGARWIAVAVILAIIGAGAILSRRPPRADRSPASLAAAVGESGVVRVARIVDTAPAAETATALPDYSDRPVFRASDPFPERLLRAREYAARIVLDGHGNDWAGLPVMEGTGAIRRAGVLATSEGILVLLDPAGGISLDFTGDPRPDTVIEFPASKGEVVEVLIPWSALSPYGPTDRSWIRAQTMRGEEFGPAVASYRLDADPSAIDPPLSASPIPATGISLPLRGPWHINQGAFGRATHGEGWMYDLSKMDREGFTSSARGRRPATREIYSYGEIVTAPQNARVIISHADAQDRFVDQSFFQNVPANFVLLDVGEEKGLLFAHLEAGSVSFVRGQIVPRGHTIGRVGNTGFTSGPHLHLALHLPPDYHATAPLAFSNVRVGLLAADDDPWARDLDRWEIREGFVVRGR